MAVREDELVSSPRPQARPDVMMGGDEPQAREASGGGGKGGQAKSQEQITNSMNDKKWGYFDPYTGKKVPWFIDMINGGGKDKAGEKFEGGFGSIGLAGGLMNMLGIDPYGQSRERTYGGGDFYRGGDLDPSLLYQFGRTIPTPAGGGIPQAAPVQVTSDPRGFAPNTEPSAPTSLLSPQIIQQAQAERAIGLSPFGGSGATDVYGIGRTGEYGNTTPIPQVSAVSTELLGNPMMYTMDEYLRAINKPITPQNRIAYRDDFNRQFGM